MLGLDEPITKGNLKKIEPQPDLLGRAQVTFDDKTKDTYSVYVTRTIFDFSVMYGKNGPESCMRYDGGSDWDYWRQFAWMKEYKLHPNAHMALNPHMKGFYITDSKGTVIIRAIVYTTEPLKDDWKFDEYKWKSRTWYCIDKPEIGVCNCAQCVSVRGKSTPKVSQRLEAAVKIAKEFGVVLNTVPKERSMFTGTNSYSYTFRPILIELGKKVENLITLMYFDDHTMKNSLVWNNKTKLFTFTSDVVRGNRTERWPSLFSFASRKSALKWAYTTEELNLWKENPPVGFR